MPETSPTESTVVTSTLMSKGKHYKSSAEVAYISRKTTESVEVNKLLDPENEPEDMSLDEQFLELSQPVGISLSSLIEVECSKFCQYY